MCICEQFNMAKSIIWNQFFYQSHNKSLFIVISNFFSSNFKECYFVFIHRILLLMVFFAFCRSRFLFGLICLLHVRIKHFQCRQAYDKLFQHLYLLKNINFTFVFEAVCLGIVYSIHSFLFFFLLIHKDVTPLSAELCFFSMRSSIVIFILVLFFPLPA